MTHDRASDTLHDAGGGAVPRPPRPRLLRPHVHLAGRTWPAYGLMVCGGALAGLASAVGLAALPGGGGASPAVVLAAAAGGIAVALLLAHATRALLGAERYTFYHYQLTILAAAAAGLAPAGRPVLPVLDLLAVALAVTQSIGRLGCLAAGCCHGRPARRGVRYGAEHAAAGFPSALVGVRLLPVQAVESAALAALAVAGAALILGSTAAGSAFVLYLAGYAAVRFLTERWRGDAGRRVAAGLSEAQWTALATLAGVVTGVATGLLPSATAPGPAVLGSGVILGLLAAVAVTDALRRRRDHGWGDAVHRSEVAAALARLAAAARRAPEAVPVVVTSRGLRLSLGRVPAGDGGRRLVSFSALHRPLGAAAAHRAAALLAAAAELDGGELVAGPAATAGGPPRVWHLVAGVVSSQPGGWVGEPDPRQEAP